MLVIEAAPLKAVQLLLSLSANLSCDCAFSVALPLCSTRPEENVPVTAAREVNKPLLPVTVVPLSVPVIARLGKSPFAIPLILTITVPLRS